MAVATLLVVEDNPAHKYVLERLCREFDYDVHTADTAEDAISAVMVTHYAAILMDICLPGISGIDCAAYIREIEKYRRSAHMPIIALTSRNSEGDRIACYDAGMDDFLSKPFEAEELRKLLLRWVYQPSRPNLKILKRYNAERTG